LAGAVLADELFLAGACAYAQRAEAATAVKVIINFFMCLYY
jgi:hypothetical protein